MTFWLCFKQPNMWYLRKLLLLLCIFVIPVNSLRNYNDYRLWTFETDCKYGSQEIRLEKTGLRSAVKIRAKPKFDYSTRFTCDLTIKVPFFVGRILKVYNIDFPSRTDGNCAGDYLEVTGDEEYKFDLCSTETIHFPTAFRAKYYETVLRIRYHTENSIGRYRSEGFVLIVTASALPFDDFEKSFRCKSSTDFIWSGFICDGYENCVDGSDEDPGACREIVTTRAPVSRRDEGGINWWIVLPVLVVPFVLLLVCFVCTKQQNNSCFELLTTTSTSENRAATRERPTSVYLPDMRRNATILTPSAPSPSSPDDVDMPPPYSISTKETTSNQIRYINPPPYEALHPSRGSDLQLSATQLHNDFINKFEASSSRTNKQLSL